MRNDLSQPPELFQVPLGFPLWPSRNGHSSRNQHSSSVSLTELHTWVQSAALRKWYHPSCRAWRWGVGRCLTSLEGWAPHSSGFSGLLRFSFEHPSSFLTELSALVVSPPVFVCRGHDAGAWIPPKQLVQWTNRKAGGRVCPLLRIFLNVQAWKEASLPIMAWNSNVMPEPLHLF